MKLKFSTLLLILLTTFFNAAQATNGPSSNFTTNPKMVEEDVCALVSSVETWLEAQVLEGNTLMTYFNTTQPEFIDFANTNNINTLKVDFYWQPNVGNSIQLVTSTTIDDIYTGFSVETWAVNIENADVETGAYFIRVTINGSECGELIELPVINEEVEEEEEEVPIELPEFECGDEFINENITNQDPLLSAADGETFYITGFPVLLEFVSGGNGVFSGTAIVPLPFKKKVVKVSFNGIHVNTDRVIYQGELTAVPGDPGDYPDFTVNPDTLSIGGDICQPPPPPPGYGAGGVDEVTGLNDWGFDPTTGIHGETGTEYDENGFDIYGNHADTGSPFNEEGCNREGFDIDDEPCDPSGGPNPEAEAFANSIAGTIGTDLGNIISDLQTALQDSLNALDCPGIRTQMNSLMTTLGYNRDFIFGENDKYFVEDMHLEFNGNEPKPLVLNIDRDPNAKELEDKHVDLYHCDRSSYALKRLKDALTAMATGQEFEDLKDEILDRIRNWTDYQYGLYGDNPTAFNEWLIKQIGDIMIENSGLDSSYVSAETPSEGPSYESVNEHMRSIFDFNRNTPYYNSTASLGNEFAFDQSFTLEDASFYFRQGDQSINGIDRAFFLEAIAKEQAMVAGGSNLLPIKVEKTVGNKTYTIYLDGIVFTPGGAILDAYIIIEDPESGRRIVFKALDIGFGPTGMNVDSRLELATDVEIRLNNAAMLILKGTENTYVAWDCEGFSSMGIDAEIEFCRNFIIPLDPTTLEPKPEPERYRLSLQIQDISAWLEFYLTLDAPPFAVAQYKDVKWALTNMVLDFSSTSTPQFTPLDGYSSPYWDGSAMAPLWKGFYMENLTATLPDEFSTGSEPITASAFDILIDDCGFSGGVAVGGLIDIEEGSMGGWPFSIDEFQIRILKNQFAGAGMAGKINVPVFEENMDYEAVIYPGSFYKFTISPSEEVTMDMFLATGQIAENSKVELSYDQDAEEFLAVATLNGELHVSTDNNPDLDVNFDFPSLAFQDFKVSNKAPYFEAGTWGLAEPEEGSNNNDPGVELKFAGFGLKLSNLVPYSPGEGLAGLGFELDIVLNAGLDVKAGGGFGLEGELTDNNGRQKWKFKRVDMNKFYVDASFQGVTKIRGELEWYDENTPNHNPIWGKGFRGRLDANFKGIGINLKAAAQFGSIKATATTEAYKYFFVDALAEFGAAASATGVIQLKGFGGGVSYHMDTDYSAVNMLNPPGEGMPPMGQSISGASYTPDKDKGLGLQATVVLATIKDKIFNGTVTLAFLFNEGNGLNKISLLGSGQFLKTIDLGILPDFKPVQEALNPPASVTSKLSCFVSIEYNFNEPSFHGEFNVFLNAGPLKGAGTGGKMIDAEVHFDPGQWYIYIGRPEEGKRCGIEYAIPGIGGADVTAYMNVGTNVPPMAPLPEKVRSIAYKVNTNQTLRSSGAGIILGASMGFSISASVAGIVSATLEAEAGFDGMIREFSGFTCDDGDDLEGFYFMGQLWAYIYGEIKVFGVNVASAGIAAVLQMRIPKFWVKGTVGVEIKLLFITRRKSVKFEFGEDCFPAGEIPDPGLGMDVISFMDPFDQSEGVPTNATPTANLALELGKNYPAEDAAGTSHNYKAYYKSSTLTYSSGISIPHSYEIGEGNTSIIVKPVEMLPANEEITFEMEVRITRNGDFYAYETKTTTFTTADALDYIPESNVASSYPMNGMLNFYKDEYNTNEGHIQLIAGMPDLLTNIPEGYYQRIRLSTSSGFSIMMDYEYDALNNRITYPIPSIFLQSGNLCKVDLIRKEISQNTEIVHPIEPAPSSASLGLAMGANDDGETSPPPPANTGGTLVSNTASTRAEGPVTDDNVTDGPEQPMEPTLYTLYFRVSEYNTFNEKLDDIIATSNGFEKPLGSIENFGRHEKFGSARYAPMVEFSVDLNNDWMNNDVVRILENQEPYLCSGWVDIDINGLKSSAKIYGGGNKLMTQTDFDAGSITMPEGQSFAFRLEEDAKQKRITLFPEVFSCASNELQQLLSNCSNSNYCPVYTALKEKLEEQIPDMPDGSYSATIKYKLPGTDIVTTSRTIHFTK